MKWAVSRHDPHHRPRHPNHRIPQAHGRVRRKASARSRGEAGCLAHHCHVDVEGDTRLVFVEKWADVDAVRSHFAVPASAAFVADPGSGPG